MRGNSIPKLGASQIQVEFTDKPITAFGGLVVLEGFLEKLRVRNLLRYALPDERTSPNALPVLDIVLSFFAAVVVGASRFAHVSRVRQDETVREILGVKRIPSPSALTRYFGTFTQGQVERMAEVIWRWILKRLPDQVRSCTLDLDSSVFTRYGQQEGARKGYNPKKPGRPSHRPIFAFISELKMVANLWLRSGNTADVSGGEEFLRETLAKLPRRLKVKAVRGDAGFHSGDFYSSLEKRQLKYAVYARMDARIQRAITGAADWQAIPEDANREVTQVFHQALNWDRPRRMIIVREKIRPGKDNRGKTLFPIVDYTYTAIFTNMDDPAWAVWRFYNHRADAENRIKELKEDFGMSGFCLNSFFGTEAVLRLVAFFFNLVTLFKATILKNVRPTLKTIRYGILVMGAQLGSKGRQKIIRISARGPLRNFLKTLIDRVSVFDKSQLRCSWNQA